jgi:hypothetical protein
MSQDEDDFEGDPFGQEDEEDLMQDEIDRDDEEEEDG